MDTRIQSRPDSETRGAEPQNTSPKISQIPPSAGPLWKIQNAVRGEIGTVIAFVIGAGVVLGGAYAIKKMQQPNVPKVESKIESPAPATASAESTPDAQASSPEKTGDTQKILKEGRNNDEFFIQHENGEFSDEEKEQRTIRLPGGITLFKDIGLTFYEVTQEDLAHQQDLKRIDEIKDKDEKAKIPQVPKELYPLAIIKEKLKVLSKYTDFQGLDYIEEIPEEKQKSFNIRNVALKTGMWLPLSVDRKERKIPETELLQNYKTAIAEMKSDEKYGNAINKIIKKAGEDELLAVMMAVSNSESGNGKFSLQRHEGGHHQCFSYTMFHVLMEGPGLQARRNLKMTEGQTLHPKNSAKLFLGFLAEKSEGKPEELFPLPEHLEDFSIFYNGPNYKRDYPKRIKNFYDNAKKLFDKPTYQDKFKHAGTYAGEYQKLREEAKTTGVTALQGAIENLVKAGKLVQVDDNAEPFVFAKDLLTTPHVAEYALFPLRQIAEEFTKKSSGYKIVVSDLYRAHTDQKKIAKRNIAATKGVSTHEFGNTFDITKMRVVNPQGKTERTDRFTSLLLGILMAHQAKGEIMIVEEKLAFHIMAAKPVRGKNSTAKR